MNEFILQDDQIQQQSEFHEAKKAMLLIIQNSPYIQINFNYLQKKQQMYELSKNIVAHNRDVRSIDYYHNFIVTGGSDKKLNIYTFKNGHLELLSHTDILQTNVLSVRINKVGAEQIFVLVGLTNGKIYGFDQNCNPIMLFQHSHSISSIDFINNKTFVTGSWDGKAIVWSLQTKKQISEFGQHKHAVSVYYNKINDYVVSGSQDKALNLWNWRDGKKIKRVENAHNDIIRQISPVDEVGFITCSNDQTIKLWTSDLQQVQNCLGHTSFVFTVKAFELGSYISGGDDRTVKIWKQSDCVQTIQLPASVWQVAFDQNKDIIIGCSDGFLRIFTNSNQRKAPQQELENYNKEVLKAASKKSGMSEEQINKLQTVAQMQTLKGKKQGQIRVFKNGINPEAYMWQQGKWVKIGDVITQNNQGSEGSSTQQRRYYPGDAYFDAGQYDYVFDVDDQSGVPKVIPFNDGANALQAAQKYCMREGLTKGYIQQIRKFLMANSSKIPRSALKQQIKNINPTLLKCTPSSATIQFNDIKDPQALIKKLKEFNQLAEGQQLNERQMAHIQRMTNALQNSTSYYQVKFDGNQIDSLKKTLRWSKHLKFPVWDLLRAFLKHYQSETLFSGLSAGDQIITQLSIGLQLENKEPIYALILRTLSNILIHNTNKNAMLKHSDVVFMAINTVSKNSGLVNKNYLYAMAVFLYNFSVAILQKNLQKEDIISTFAQILKKRIQIDSDVENRRLMLQAGANILSKYYKSYGKNYEFLLNFQDESDVSGDLKVLLS